MRPTRFASLLLLATCLTAMPAIANETAVTAAPQQVKTQAPGYYRLMVGDIEVTALYDGSIGIDNKLLKGLSEEEKETYLNQAFLDYKNGVQTAVNGFLVNTGKELVLIDTGAAKKFGPTMGNLSDNIRAAGYKPEDVTTVLLTHLHPDHVSGLETPDGKVLFPNATVYTSKAEADFWLNPENEKKAPKDKQPMFALSRAAIEPYNEKGRFHADNMEGSVVSIVAADGKNTPLEGITAIHTAGHTPGHTSFLITSKGQKLLVWGDIVHSHSIQFQRPEVSLEFDSDSQAAIATRKKILEESAKEKWWVAGAHLPFPGIGHVRKDGSAYRWVPVEYAPVK